MATEARGTCLRTLCTIGLLFALAGCASGNVRFGNTGPRGDMSGYRTVAITVVNDIGEKCPVDVPENLQAAAIKRMKSQYSGAFEDVRPAIKGESNELLAEVHITKYKKGSRFARSMLIGLGASTISTTVNMIDAPSKETINSGKLGLTWAIGGVVGASKGIEDLVNDAGGKIADAIFAFKGGKEQVAVSEQKPAEQKATRNQAKSEDAAKPKKVEKPEKPAKPTKAVKPASPAPSVGVQEKERPREAQPTVETPRPQPLPRPMRVPSEQR